MILNLDDYNKLEEAARRSLTHLRMVRDSLAERIQLDLEGLIGAEDAEDLIEDVTTGWSPQSGIAQMRWRFGSLSFGRGYLDLVDAFEVVCKRIAELERAAWSQLQPA